jgi:hypothetical protein
MNKRRELGDQLKEDLLRVIVRRVGQHGVDDRISQNLDLRLA